MKTSIIVSKTDPAGMNIKERLLELYKFEKTDENFENNPVYQLNDIKLYTVEKESIFNEDIDKKINSDLFIFATKHQSASGVHSLCVHTQGNWGKAEFGGKDRKLCTAPAKYLRTALFLLKKNNNLDYEVIQEVTHHGPYLDKQCFFIEIGSNEESWKNKEAAKVIANTIIEVLENKPKNYAVTFGIGGLHHTPILTKTMEKQDIAFGHVCPKYNLQNLDKEMILQALEKTEENVDFVVLDWKGLGKEKQRILDLLKELKLEVKRSDKI